MPRRTTDDLAYLWAITDWNGNYDEPESLSMDRDERMESHGWMEDNEITEQGRATAVKIHVEITDHYQSQDMAVGEMDYTVTDVRELIAEQGVTEFMAPRV